MIRKSFLLLFKLLLVLIVIGASGLLISRLLILVNSWSSIFAPEEAPFHRIAIVFGAGLRRDGTPTPVLRDRIETAATLYSLGKVEKLLMSGGKHSSTYNEPKAMRDYAISIGIPPTAIYLDEDGHSTFETCYRAKNAFEISDAILVTQSFHLPRALYTCNALGVKAIGVSADMRIYRQVSRFFWNMRELPASIKALWDVHISQPMPASGKPDPNYPYEAQ